MTSRRAIGTTLLAWTSMLGLDFFLHGGLLAGIYTQDSPFLLPPREAFRLIPLGYLSFLLLAVLLVWLMKRLGISGWRAGATFGLQSGALIWGAFSLGLLSISTAPPKLMTAWFVGQSIELAAAGAVAGTALKQNAWNWRLVWQVAGLVLVLFILTIVMQNIGLAPSVRLPR